MVSACLSPTVGALPVACSAGARFAVGRDRAHVGLVELKPPNRKWRVLALQQISNFGAGKSSVSGATLRSQDISAGVFKEPDGFTWLTPWRGDSTKSAANLTNAKGERKRKATYSGLVHVLKCAGRRLDGYGGAEARPTADVRSQLRVKNSSSDFSTNPRYVGNRLRR
ncbi:hypothetical protein ON010_g8498 [Phytophthora cinnamomi]|nr:hypothetical protein ON010_g8498 [Phytophthora cinnamomi]